MGRQADADSVLAWGGQRARPFSTVSIPIDLLRPPDSPRLAGVDAEHARLLAESGAALPPIIVHRPTMRVIDGMHRLSAAMLRGQSEIEAHLYAGGEDDAFVLAVETNIAHGLPLSLADRTAAAERIIRSHPNWSDRAIASSTGLAASTVSAIRKRSTDQVVQLNSRIGRDGRTRPVSSAEGRRLASELIADNPDASLREIASIAGISPGTVRDVRKRLEAGDDPVPPMARRTEQHSRMSRSPRRQRDNRTSPADRAAILRELRKDPSLRFSETGRALLRWLDTQTIGMVDWEKVVENVPDHCVDTIVDLARANAYAWQKFAERLERRVS
jgi:ParB-like chromosome segregation protein Spo0J